MRVVAGAYKGHPIKSPRRGSARPTQDRVREALFSMLGPVDGLRVLDLFAGSGALGIEALSRGASGATFVDADAACIAGVAENLERLGIEDAGLFRSDALAFLEGAARHAERWDLVFCDPPYGLVDRLSDDLSGLLEPVLAPQARVVCESSTRQPLKLALPVHTERRYGDTLIVIHSNGKAATGHPDAS
jgi:16S rRNA (guanine966-N2)-methyltransferase